MRTIDRTTQFKRDYKRQLKSKHRDTLELSLVKVLKLLVTDQVLDTKYKDHALSGNWKDHRDCHIKPDLVLIYRKVDDKLLQLVWLGPHSELGL